jgi:hypothetical protein
LRPLAEIAESIRSDPVKLKRVFTAIWVVAYSMLIFGAVLIIWALLTLR